MVREESSQVFRQRVREMPPRGRLPATQHGPDLPQLRSELVHQGTVDDAGAQRGAVGVVVVHLEGAEHQVAQLREWGPVAQPGNAAGFRPARAASLDETAKWVHQVRARRERSRDQGGPHVAEAHHDDAQRPCAFHRLSPDKRASAPALPRQRCAAAVPLSIRGGMR